MEITLKITPVPKPRMTKSDAWKKRTCVQKYWRFKDEVNAAWNHATTDPLPEAFHAIFYLPMPKSWGKKKRESMLGTKHQQKPDTDNLTKALKDCLCLDDSYVWDERATKIWTDGPGQITVRSLDSFAQP